MKIDLIPAAVIIFTIYIFAMTVNLQFFSENDQHVQL